MIHAFVQRLRCGDHLIVRAGPLATEMGRRYRKSCLGEIDGDSVTLMAFCEPWWIQLLRRWFPRLVGSLAPYVKASIRALYADGFKKVHLDRLTANPRRLVFTQGDEEGKITMKSFSREHINKSHKGKADYDRAQVSADLRAMADANDASHITLVTRRISDPNVPSSKTAGKMSSLAFLEWEHN